MTDERLDKIESNLKFITENAWEYPADYIKQKAKEAIKELQAYKERLASDELVEEVAKVVFDKIDFCGFSDRESRIIAKAALSTITKEQTK